MKKESKIKIIQGSFEVDKQASIWLNRCVFSKPIAIARLDDWAGAVNRFSTVVMSFPVYSTDDKM